MNRKKLNTAVAEAERFIARAKALPECDLSTYDHFPKQWGAIRRASMDLTRALADLRKYP